MCQRCVLGMDHHCVFTDNCVGDFNLKAYLLFVFYSFVGSVSAALVNASFLVVQLPEEGRRLDLEGGWARIVAIGKWDNCGVGRVGEF